MKQSKLRLFLLGAVVWAVFGLFILRLAQIQIVEGQTHLQKQQQGSVKSQTIKAPRGEIVDRNGSPFSRNNARYDLVFDKALAPADSENDNIMRLIEILRSTGEEWIDSLPLVLENGEPVFTDDDAAVARLRKHLDTNIYSTASDLFYWLKERYDLTELSDTDARAVAGVRYEMERKGYSVSARYTFAEDISLNTAIIIRQKMDDFPGVEVAETASRGYVDGDLAPHIIGRIGAIFPDELEDYLSRGEGYTREDMVGKEGIERAFESTLRGEDGVRRIELDHSYHVVDISEQQPAIPGSTVVLTIDKDIQRTARDALIREIKYLNENAPEGEGKEANAGAVVAIDIKSSEILAAVTYPSYNLETFSQDYSQTASDPLYPFLNRAFSGVYAPGSCFKPVVAAAGIAEGIATPTSTVSCEHTYAFYPTYQPTCLGWHGKMTAADALRASCNVYFYDVGRQLGIAKINEYARALGLGVPTGIELSESKGTQCDPDTVYPGDALQAAIGQLDNGYTPVQLANYCATIARRGVRMKLSLIKSISSYYDWTDTIEEHTPQVESVLDVDPAAFDAVFDGMHQAAQDIRGTAYRYVGDYPISIACKTGTPQTHQFPNSTFICFAPVEDPQIAIAVVIEKGWHGYTGAPVARAVMDSYFFPDKEPSPHHSEKIAASAEAQTAVEPPQNQQSEAVSPQ